MLRLYSVECNQNATSLLNCTYETDNAWQSSGWPQSNDVVLECINGGAVNHECDVHAQNYTCYINGINLY